MTSIDGSAPGADVESKPGSADPPRTGFPMRERSALATVLGVPPVAAVGLASGCTLLGVFVDIMRIGTIGGVFTTIYFVGCVIAVAWVRRRNLFGPMVQPPLLLAAAVPVVVLLAAPPRSGSGTIERLIAVGAPLVNAFPTMASTTAVVLAVGGLRILLQPVRPAGRGSSRRVSARRGSGAAREAARTSASPEQS